MLSKISHKTQKTSKDATVVGAGLELQHQPQSHHLSKEIQETAQDPMNHSPFKETQYCETLVPTTNLHQLKNHIHVSVRLKPHQIG